MAIHNTVAYTTLHKCYVVGQKTAILDRNILPEYRILYTPIMLDGN